MGWLYLWLLAPCFNILGLNLKNLMCAVADLGGGLGRL